ncbi:hypothetical protein U0C82_12040 [Fulvimarina sp. 2208YS6-2-32]|uniref:Uncharacterized protein n=1 Tax=Fulvimarina uroteuthidis TaxID=3098149 RepID=A0ABU5I459_9HYPH|nr:hypothetical protein [Fulvimarina sp. 2208YS6-2-32]MDY8109870.1 hypothetical protein [Fulvimarina sp. 2208YS6-2-32]
MPVGRGCLNVLRGVWHSVCDRLAEWLLTIWLLDWGLTLAHGGTFESPAVSVMTSWARIEAWQLFCLVGGGCRLLLLVVNGGWRKSPHVRVFASLATMPLWAVVAYGLQMSGTDAVGAGAYYACVLAEMVGMYRATKEAGWNDGRAFRQGSRG